MVHSLRALKAEGDKSGAANKQATGKQQQLDNSATTTTATTTSQISLNTEGFGSGQSSLGSDCLFSSTDELLDFHSDYFNNDNANNTNRQPLDYPIASKTVTCKAFSIDDIDEEKVFPSASAAASKSSKQQHQYYPQASQSQQSARLRCLIWAERHWKATKWRFNPQTIRTLKMTLKRHYLLVLLLCLILVSCLLASFVISRTLDSIGDGDNYGDTSKQESTSMSLAQNSGQPPVEFERRIIDLVDLIECGKTFAFTKLRVQVRVPKLSPIYRQQPINESAHRISAAIENVDEPQQQASEVKYFLTSLPEAPGDFDSATSGAETETQSFAFDSSMISPADEQTSMINSPIKPVQKSAISGSTADEEAPKGSTVLKRFKRPTRDIEDQQRGSPSAINDEEAYLQDPLMSAASEMNVKVEAVNKTVIDCFIVDTDKRLGQKVAFEDKYRLVARTRRVPFKRMMDTIVACRKLTWANLLANKQNTAVQKVLAGQSAGQLSLVEPAVGGSDLVRVPRAEQAALQRPSSDFLGSLFGGWLGNGGQNQRAIDDGANPQVAEARQVESARLPNGASVEPKRAEQRADGSYFNLGMSMVSGIVPNTLWCGLGDRAANYSELGAEFQVDACCRAHDHCPIRLKPFTTDYGLVNWSMSTRSHCDCDLDFNECLNALNSTLSNVIRVLYFRFVGLQCIDVEGKRNSM